MGKDVTLNIDEAILKKFAYEAINLDVSRKKLLEACIESVMTDEKFLSKVRDKLKK